MGVELCRLPHFFRSYCDGSTRLEVGEENTNRSSAGQISCKISGLGKLLSSCVFNFVGLGKCVCFIVLGNGEFNCLGP